jgi:hypothetical protein
MRAGSRVLIESSRVYTSLDNLIIEPNFVFISSSFNNRFEHASSLFKPISNKFTSSSTRLHPRVRESHIFLIVCIFLHVFFNKIN